MAYQQAAIPVQKEAEFYALRGAIDRVFSVAQIHSFLRGLKKAGVKVRQFERVLEKELLERADAELARSGRKARELYGAMALSDQAQIREFYLVRLEEATDDVREKFASVYRDY